MAQPLQVIRVMLQRAQCPPHQVVEVHPVQAGQPPLVVGVDGPAHLQQGARQGRLVQHRAQVAGLNLPILGLPDEAESDVARQPGPVPLLATSILPLFFAQIVAEEVVHRVRVAPQPGLHRILPSPVGLPLVHDVEVIR